MRINGLQLVALIEQAQHLEDFERAIARSVASQPDAGAILDFFEVPSVDAFDVPPNEAIGYFKAKGLKPTFSFADMLGEAHDNAFTVAKMMDVDLLSQVRASLDAALTNGTSFKAWANDLIPQLQAAGWWGKQDVIDPLTGQKTTAQLGSAWRLETIFRTNMQSAYAAGQWQEIEAQADIAPFLMYDAVDDFRTREAHRAWDRKVLPVTSPWWATHYPPNGWNCRCGVIQLSAAEAKQLGLTIDKTPPADGVYSWKNPRTGEVLKVPNGIDPGFAKNAGASHSANLQALLNEKIEAMASATLKRAARAAQAKMTALSALQDETAEQLVKAEALAAENLRALQARVTAQAKELEAQQQIDMIAKGKEAVGGAGAQYKVKALAQLSKGDDWPELKPTEKLAAIEKQAGALKFQNEQASKLAAYKKAIIEGKTPAPNQVKAFNLLTPEDQAKMVAKIEAEKAAIAAKKAAAAEAAAKEAAQAAQAQAAPTPKVASLIDTDAPNPDDLVLVGAKTKGSNEGGIYQDQTTGVRYMVKFNGSEDNVRNEVLAGKLYQLAGVEAPELHAITLGGRPAIASRIVDGIKEVDGRTLAATESVMNGFAVDAWLANWDAVGLAYDNIVLIGGRAMRIDVGGSLRYRAMGGLKGKAFGDTVTEIDSLRDPSLNRTSFDVFKNITNDQIEAGVVRVLRVSDDDIRATVEKFGPVDPADRAALIDRLIARKRDLARRYPEAAKRAQAADLAPTQAAPKSARVTDTEQGFVEDSRVNGYGFATDSDQIEDHMVTVHAFDRADGTKATRGFFKLREQASRELAARIAETTQDTAPSVNTAPARDSILAAVKSINFRADKGAPFDATVEAKVKNAILEVDRALAQIKAMKTSPMKAEQLQFVEYEFARWRDMLSQSLPDIQKFGPAKKVGAQFLNAAIPDRIDFEAPAKIEAGGVTWRRVSGSYEFNVSRFERSFAQETTKSTTVSGVSLRYEATLADGTNVVYFPHDSSVAWAMQGIVKIDAPGRGADSTTRVFDAMAEIGLKSQRAGELDRKHLYLNAFARIRLLRGKANAKAAFEAVEGNDEAALAAKLKILRDATGVDVEKSAGWRAVDGVRQAFGHGRAYQLRPDLDTPEFDQFARDHVLFHNPQGLGSDSGSGVFDRLKAVVDGGGVMASLTDRVRRGVPLAGSSVSSDLLSGGAEYFFTRIKQRGTTGTGLYWRANAIKRMDAITYNSDQFGRTTAGHVEANRLGQDVPSMREAARSNGNETIFKIGLSLFDDLDRIVLSSQAEVNDAIEFMKSRGYTAWPDGRKLDDVIMTKARNNAKP